MFIKLIIEILLLWIWFGIYMVILVGKKGPKNALYFYPKQVSDKAIEIGLINREQFNNGKTFAYILLIVGDLFIPYIMIVLINDANTFIEYFSQYCLLFYAMEFFDWFVVDTLWVAKSNWWVIPELSDLNYLWHDTSIKKNKMIKIIPITIIFSFVFTFLCLLISKI